MTTALEDFSLEMTGKDRPNLEAAAGLIPPGTEIAIAFLPNEDTEARVAAARCVAHAGFVPIPHISARRISTAMELDTFLDRLTCEAGVDRVFVVAGDLAQPIGPFEDALALINSGSLARHAIGRVGIAGYPEGHPDISTDRLWTAIKAKRDTLQRLGHPYEVVTQFGFDVDAVLEWLKRLRDEGIHAPVKIGVPGLTNIKTLMRFATRCGVGTSAKVMAKYGFSLSRLLGTAGPDVLIDSLESQLHPSLHGEVKIHFFPFGGIQQTADWIRHFLTMKRTADAQKAAGNYTPALASAHVHF